MSVKFHKHSDGRFNAEIVRRIQAAIRVELEAFDLDDSRIILILMFPDVAPGIISELPPDLVAEVIDHLARINHAGEN